MPVGYYAPPPGRSLVAAAALQTDAFLQHANLKHSPRTGACSGEPLVAPPLNNTRERESSVNYFLPCKDFYVIIIIAFLLKKANAGGGGKII